jgi:biotin/methionine sulfoxide reductase
MATLKMHAAHWGAFNAIVDNGRVVGTKPFVKDPHPSDLIRAMPEVVHSPCRIDRPYVRKRWLSGCRSDATRQDDDFVPISWDRAIMLVADEIRRVRESHGSTAIYGGSYGWSSAGRFHHAKTQLQRFLAAGGGFTGSLYSYSYGAAQAFLPHVLGSTEVATGRMTDWAAITRHAKLMICFGGLPLRNMSSTAGGPGEHSSIGNIKAAVDAGLKIIYISPQKEDVPAWCEAEWIPIRPGGDTALMLALAYELVESGRADETFLKTRCAGWERVHAYIRGEVDGVPKSPEWAQSLTTVPSAVIRATADRLVNHPCMMTATWSLQRADNGEQPYWMLIALASIIGNIGKPGQGVAFGYGSMNGIGNPRHNLPTVSMPGIPNSTGVAIPVARITDMLERPGGRYEFNGSSYEYPHTKLIWWAGGNPFHHHQNLNRLLKAWNSVETIVVNEQHWTSTARLADIVFPSTTTLERNDIANTSYDRYVIAMHQAINPVDLARNDFDIFSDLSDALGFRHLFCEGRGEMDWLNALFDSWREKCSQVGINTPAFDEFWERGWWEAPVIRQDEEFTQFQEFNNDPDLFPLRTPSGKIELFSERIASFRYADLPGHPVWREPREWLGAKLAERFPLHLLTCQPATRLHSQLDMGRIAQAEKVKCREPIYLNSADAKRRGLMGGDVVRVFNDRGACLAGVRIDEMLEEGVVVMATGAWFVPGINGMCVHGNPNVLTSDAPNSTLSQATSAQSCLVEVEKWDGDLPVLEVFERPISVRNAALG